MEAKQKAKELIRKFYSIGAMECKKCALIVVDEIMQELTTLPYGMQYLSRIDYWEGIKQEIEKL